MTANIETVTLINEETVKGVISIAEKSLKDCWSKLTLLQSNTTSKKDWFDAFFSFQPDLFKVLVELESFYNEVCEIERDLISKKAIIIKIFPEQMQKHERYKRVLDGIIDIGKTLGDAFAWIFYQHNRPLLKKHYEHEFIPRLPSRLGGRGEVEFIRNHQVFGRYFVLSHSITTFLREGDYNINLDRVLSDAKNIINKSLPDNGLIIGFMPYPAKKRYELQLRMRPLFWWPLSAEVREAIIFKRMVVMTLYNPAFLINDLRKVGFDVEFTKEGSIGISKRYGAGRLILVGVRYLYEMIQAHLFSEDTIIALIQKPIERLEKADIKRKTYVDLDYDFVFQ